MTASDLPPANRQQIENDHSADFSALRTKLRGPGDTSYTAFLKSLTPDYGLVWRDIGLGYLGVAAAMAPALLVQEALTAWLLVPISGCLAGFFVAYLQLFIHEAAHHNIAPDKAQNDRLANLFIGWWLGTEIKSYRRVHLHHHRALGKTDDSEHSYFNALSSLYLLRCLTGIEAIAVMLDRRARNSSKRESGAAVLLAGLLMHLAVLFGLYLVNGVTAALTWLAAIGAFTPFFMALRQVLEHRKPDAKAAHDYSQADHGPYTRLFGTGLFARIFGGAGFNRHLLHHWEPQISYTRFDELEALLRQSEAAEILQTRRSSYGETFIRLLRQARA